MLSSFSSIQHWPTRKTLHLSTLWGHWMLSRELTKNDDQLGWNKTEELVLAICFDGDEKCLYNYERKHIWMQKYYTASRVWFDLVWFYGTSTIVGYLIPNPFLNIKTVLFQIIQLNISTQFHCKKQFYFKQFSLALPISPWRTLLNIISTERFRCHEADQYRCYPNSTRLLTFSM